MCVAMRNYNINWTLWDPVVQQLKSSQITQRFKSQPCFHAGAGSKDPSITSFLIMIRKHNYPPLDFFSLVFISFLTSRELFPKYNTVESLSLYIQFYLLLTIISCWKCFSFILHGKKELNDLSLQVSMAVI